MRLGTKIILMMALAGLVSPVAWADRGRSHSRQHHSHGHIHWGVQVGSPWAFSPYPYWPPRVVHMPATVVIATPPPTVYVEQSPTILPAVPATMVPALEPGYWYYCNEAGAYYPQVRQCAGNWHKVSPQLGR